MDYASFKDFQYEGYSYEILNSMPYKEIEGCSYYSRIYYKPDEVKGCGFLAIALSAIETRIPDDNYFNHPSFGPNDGIILLANAWAAFDGIRHFFIGFNEQYDNNGYINYFNPNEWIAIFKGFKELENEFCREVI